MQGNKCLSAILGVAAIGFGIPAEAAGLFLYEMATPDLGTAAAGRAAMADNAATAFGNPAGMTRLDTSQMLIGVQPGYGVSHFDKGSDTTVSGGNGGNALGVIPGLGAYFVYSASPDVKFGLSLGSNFGLSAQYQSNWSGRYYALKSELITAGAFPVAAYRINRWLSIGAGAQIIYGKQDSKTGINDVLDGGDASISLDSTDVGYGGMAGVLIEPVEGTRFGVTYQSQVKLDFKDRPKTNNLGPLLADALDVSGLSGAKVDLGLTIPNQVMVSGYHDLTDTVAIVGNVVWQQWSQFGQPSLEVTSTTSEQRHHRPGLQRYLGILCRRALPLRAGLAVVGGLRLRHLADVEKSADPGFATRPADPRRHRRPVCLERARHAWCRLRVPQHGRRGFEPQQAACRYAPRRLLEQRDPFLQRNVEPDVLRTNMIGTG